MNETTQNSSFVAAPHPGISTLLKQLEPARPACSGPWTVLQSQLGMPSNACSHASLVPTY